VRRTPWLSPGEFPFLSCEISKINPQGLYLDVLYVGVGVGVVAPEATEATEAFGMAVVLVQQQQLLLLLLLLVLVLLLLLP
jgi:hypothetical protein